MRSAFAAFWVVAFCALAALATWLAFPPADVERIMGETGPVEMLTAATYALCAVAIWWARGGVDDLRSVAASSVVMLAFCMRELDWHRHFTGTSVLRLSWYAGPASVGAKLAAASVLLVVLAALAWLVLRHAREVWQGWRERRPMAVTLMAFLATLVLAKALDRSVGILVGDYGVDVPLVWKALRTAFEEWFELGLSMLVMLALLQRRIESPRS
jgi:hypothetical protein